MFCSCETLSLIIIKMKWMIATKYFFATFKGFCDFLISLYSEVEWPMTRANRHVHIIKVNEL